MNLRVEQPELLMETNPIKSLKLCYILLWNNWGGAVGGS